MYAEKSSVMHFHMALCSHHNMYYLIYLYLLNSNDLVVKVYDVRYKMNEK